MADFIAVIRRAVDGLSTNTPEMRAKVYDKARSAVMRQLENMNPRPPEQMLQRQLDKLNAAIREVEAEHAEALPEEEAVEAFEETMAPQPVERPWQEEQPAVAAPESVFEAEPVAPTPVAEPIEERQPEVASSVPHDEVEDPWAEPAPAPASAEPSDEPVVEPEQYGTSAPEPEAAAPYFEEPHPAPAPAEPVHPEPVHAEPAFDEPPQWAAAPVDVDAPAVPPAPAYDDVDRYALPSGEPEAVYAAPIQAEEPEEHRESVRAEEAEAELADLAGTYAEPAPAPAPSVPAYNRLVEMPITHGDDWLGTRSTDFGARPVAAEEPKPAAPAQPAFEPWEIPGEPQRLVEEPVFEPVRPEPSQVQTAASTGAAPLDPLDWDGSAYAEPARKPADATSQELPVADDFSDWFAEYDKPKADADVPAGVAQPADAAALSFEPDAFVPAAVAPGRQAEDVDAFLAESQQRAYRLEPKKSRNYAPLVLGVLAVALLAGGGFAAWTYRDQVSQFVSGLTGSAPTDVAGTGETQTPPGGETATGTDAPGATPAGNTPPANGAADDGAVTGQKFTQRLLPDGTEVDEGAGTTAPGGSATEGRSVSEQNVASTVEPTDQPPVGTNAGAATATAPASTTPAAADAIPAANGERAFLYEERLGQTSPTAVPGTIAWTALRETGEDGKPNPAIQGKITIPDRGLTALITIKRNSDSSLPASHLIEVVFSVPADFEGGAIDKLERIAMKRTEQDRGDPLVAVSAKVTDDTYLVALNDFQDVMKANLDLLANRGWIDIPISYRNGRRALLTLDKGAAGKAVFDQVIREWAALGTPGN